MIRAYRLSDRERIEELHKQSGFDYELPDFARSPFPIRIVNEQDGRIVMAAFAHVTAEIYMLADATAGTPRDRWRWFQQMHGAGLQLAYTPGGFDDLHAFLPPTIEKHFGRRLKRLGWQKATWPCYTIGVEQWREDKSKQPTQT